MKKQAEKKQAEAKDYQLEINEGDFVSAKVGDDFYVGILTQKNEEGIKIKAGQNVINLPLKESELWRLGFGQKFDKRELESFSQNLQFKTKDGKVGSLIETLGNDSFDLKQVLRGNQTEQTYFIQGKEDKEYKVRIQLKRENGRAKIEPVFELKKDLTKQLEENYKFISKEQHKELLEGKTVSVLNKNKEGEEYVQFYKVDPELNRINYLNESKYLKQLEVAKVNKSLTPNMMTDLLNGETIRTKEGQTLKYDFKNGKLTRKNPKKAETQTQKKPKQIKV